MNQYHLVFIHPELGRLDGQAYAHDELSYLQTSCRNVAMGNIAWLSFLCANGRHYYLNAAQLAAGILWIEPVGKGESPAGEPPPMKRFQEESVKAAD